MSFAVFDKITDGYLHDSFNDNNRTRQLNKIAAYSELTFIYKKLYQKERQDGVFMQNPCSPFACTILGGIDYKKHQNDVRYRFRPIKVTLGNVMYSF